MQAKLSLAPGTSSSSPSPSPLGTDLSGSPDYSTNFGIVPKDGDLPARTKSSPSAGYIITVAVCWIALNSFIALCLVWARNRKKASRKKCKKAARKNALELPAGDIPAELQDDGLYELDIALPELNEDTFHEMFVPPLELSGDMWPELDGRSF